MFDVVATLTYSVQPTFGRPAMTATTKIITREILRRDLRRVPEKDRLLPNRVLQKNNGCKPALTGAALRMLSPATLTFPCVDGRRR